MYKPRSEKFSAKSLDKVDELSQDMNQCANNWQTLKHGNEIRNRRSARHHCRWIEIAEKYCVQRERKNKERREIQPTISHKFSKANEWTHTHIHKAREAQWKKAYRLYVVSFAYFYARTLEKVLAQQLYDSGSKFFFLFTAFFFFFLFFYFFCFFSFFLPIFYASNVFYCLCVNKVIYISI